VPKLRNMQSETQGGLAQLLSQQGGNQEVIDAAKQIESMPGGPQLLYTQAAQKMLTRQGVPKAKAKQLRLYSAPDTGITPAMAHGGSTRRAAETARRAGRGDDSMMLHLAPDEYDAITAMWGKPTINPKTGIGEYGFLSSAWKKIKHAVKKVVGSPIFQTVAPIALAVFAPWAAPAIGAFMGASGTAATIAGNAVIQGGLGAVAGGKEGAIRGAVSGAISGGLGEAAGKAVGLSGKTADIAGSATLQGLGSKASGGDFGEGAVQGGLNAAVTRPMVNKFVAGAQDYFGTTPTTPEINMDPGSADPMNDSPVVKDGAISGGIYGDATAPGSAVASAGTPGGAAQAAGAAQMGKGTSIEDYALPAILGLGALGGSSQGGYGNPKPPLYPEDFNEPLPQYSLKRSIRPMDPNSYYTYGRPGAPMSGQHLFLGPESYEKQGGLAAASAPSLATPPGQGSIILPPGNVGASQRQALEQQGWTFNGTTNEMIPPQAQPQTAAQGRYVRGPGTGRSDDIEARLSDGEYVVDAETVSLLGDGSGDAGARRLDEMRRNLRQHKATNLKKGEFTHKAKPPAKYMSMGGGMKALRRAQIAAGRN